jgi:hypothetical protein
LLGVHFETYELFISLIFQFFSACGKPRILNQRIWGHNCIHCNTATHLTLSALAGFVPSHFTTMAEITEYTPSGQLAQEAAWY